jgi:hypothetical protein
MIDAFTLTDIPDQPTQSPTHLRARSAVIQAIAGGTEDAVAEDFVAAVATTIGSEPEALNAARVAGELAGASPLDELMEAMSLRRAQQLAETAAPDLLCRAVLALVTAQAATWMFLLVVVPFNPDRSALLQAALDDPLWQFCVQLPPPRPARGADLHLALWATQLTLAAPSQLAELEQFTGRLLAAAEATVLAGHLPGQRN